LFFFLEHLLNILSNRKIATIFLGEKLGQKDLNDCDKDANVLGICKTYDKNETGG